MPQPRFFVIALIVIGITISGVVLFEGGENDDISDGAQVVPEAGLLTEISEPVESEDVSANETSENATEQMQREIPEISPRKNTVLLSGVPFTSQAPFGEWSNPIFQDACEEASLIMAAYWLMEKSLTPEIAKEEIERLAKYQRKIFGHSIDTSAADTAKILEANYDLSGASIDVRFDVTLEDMQNEITAGNLLIVPADGQKLKNPHFTPPGPPIHMLVVVGHDPLAREFITNDPGTRVGKHYRYAEEVLFGAMMDYPTSEKHSEVQSDKKAMIVVDRNDS